MQRMTGRDDKLYRERERERRREAEELQEGETQNDTTSQKSGRKDLLDEAARTTRSN